MPDDLYDRDILIWSEHQADLLRRLARGEGVHGVDWDHVVEEIEDVGRSELRATEGFLSPLLVDLLKTHGWPEAAARHHWRAEIVAFQQNAARRFAPSMRQKIDLARLYAEAVDQLEDERYDGVMPNAWPLACPFTLDQLLTERRGVLEERLRLSASSC
jgi:hypothetical protein